MKIERKALLKALETVKAGLGSATALEQTTAFAFAGDKVATYNDSISIATTVPGLDITGAVSAQELWALLNKLKSEIIELTITEHEVIVKAKKTEAGLALKEVNLPLDEVLSDESKWKPLPSDFLEGIKIAAFSCAKDSTRPTLTCVHIRKDQVIESCDGYRITQFSLSKKLPIQKNLLIPASSLQALAKFDVVEIAVVSKAAGWVKFKTEAGTVFACRSFEAEYPDLSEAIKVQKGMIAIELPEEIIDGLGRASIFAKDSVNDEELVSVTLKENQMIMSAKNEAGWITDSIDVTYDDKELTFSTNPALLSDIAKKIKTCQIGTDKMIFTGDNWVHYISLE